MIKLFSTNLTPQFATPLLTFDALIFVHVWNVTDGIANPLPLIPKWNLGTRKPAPAIEPFFFTLPKKTLYREPLIIFFRWSLVKMGVPVPWKKSLTPILLQIRRLRFNSSTISLPSCIYSKYSWMSWKFKIVLKILGSNKFLSMEIPICNLLLTKDK